MLKLSKNLHYHILLLLILFGGAVISCNTTKPMATESGRQQLDELVANKSFVIESDHALPMATNSLNSISNAGLLPPGSSASQISLIGNPNYLKVIGDSVAVYLPYFGERQMGGGYDNDGPGIKFEGVPQDMEINKDDEKHRYDIRFKMRDNSETFTVNIVLFPNLSSMINVNSSQRFPIRYSGHVSAFDNPDD